MGEVISGVVSILGKGLLVWLAIAISSAVVLFSPPGLLSALALLDVRQTYGPLLGAALVVSVALSVLELMRRTARWFGPFLRRWWSRQREERQAESAFEEFERLPFEARAILAAAVLHDACFFSYPRLDAAAQYLVDQGWLVPKGSGGISGYLYGAGQFSCEDNRWFYLLKRRSEVRSVIETRPADDAEDAVLKRVAEKWVRANEHRV